MKFRIDKKYIHWGFTAFLVIAASILFYYLLFHKESISSGFHTFATITMPIWDGLILAYLLTPILNSVEKRLCSLLCGKCHVEDTTRNKKRIRMLSILITVVIVTFLIYSFFATIIPQLIHSIQSIILQFPIYINNLTIWVQKLLADNPDIEAAVIDMMDEYSGELNNFLNLNLLPKMNELIRDVSLSFLSFLKTLWNLIIGFIISIYILGSKELFAGQAKKIVYALFETDAANAIISDVRFTHRTFSGFMVGKVIDSIIIGIICFFGISIMDIPYAILISVIVGITNVIPFFGPYLGAIPSALLILMVNPLQCLYFIIFILVLQQFDGNVLGPKILGDSTGLSGFWVIFSITLFGGIFGILGMIAGVPVFAVIYAGIRAFINQLLLQKKLPTDTADYLNVGSIEKGKFIPYEVKNKAGFPNSDSDSNEGQGKNKSIIHQFFRSNKDEIDTKSKGQDTDDNNSQT
ncbi:AI-2E family transporter [Lachnospiraceae bacterium]|nr:AI-2E family transporter [Lachnospiraceae bacterium]